MASRDLLKDAYSYTLIVNYVENCVRVCIYQLYMCRIRIFMSNSNCVLINVYTDIIQIIKNCYTKRHSKHIIVMVKEFSVNF